MRRRQTGACATVEPSFWFIQVKGHLAFALFLLTATWLAPFREDAAKRYLPQPSLLGSEENRGQR